MIGSKARWRAMGVVVGLAALLAGTVGLRAQDADWEKVVAAAKKEGSLVIYNGTSQPAPKAIMKMFEQAYGITVNTVDGRPSEVRERIRAEQASGRFAGDLHIAGITT